MISPLLLAYLFMLAWLFFMVYWTYLVVTTFRSVRRAADLYYRLHTRGPSRAARPAKKTSPAAEALEQLAGGQ